MRKIAMPKYALAALLAALAFPAAAATTTTRFDFDARVFEAGGTRSFTGNIVPLGVDSGLSYSTFVVASADQQYRLTKSGNGWTAHQLSFSSFDSFVASLQQPWGIHLDAGLATERNYTMALNLGDLLATDLTPPIISFPAHGATITTLSPTFTFTTPINQSLYIQLHEVASGADVVPVGIIPGGTNSWFPAATLQSGLQYVFNIYTGPSPVAINGFGFSTPVDSGGSGLANWQSRGVAEMEGAAQFTAVPEPNAALLFCTGTGVFFLCSVLCERERRGFAVRAIDDGRHAELGRRHPWLMEVDAGHHQNH